MAMTHDPLGHPGTEEGTRNATPDLKGERVRESAKEPAQSGQSGRWLLLLGALLFAVAGQVYFAKQARYFWDGVVFYTLAAICTLLLARPARVVSETRTVSVQRSREDWLRGGLNAAGLALAAFTVVQLLQPPQNHWPVFWTWLAGMALCLLAAVPLPQRPFVPSMRSVFQGIAWREVAAVAGVFVLALVLRAWRVDLIPWTLSGDEGNFGRWAREVLDGRWTNMFNTGHLSMPSLYAFFQAGWLRIAGDNVVGLRLPWAIVGALSVLGSTLLVRRLFGHRMALLVGLLVAGYSYHIHYSRLGLNNIADPFFVVWALYFAVRGLQTPDGKSRDGRWAWLAAGLLTGLAFYFYTGGRQVAVILVAVLAWAALLERDFWQRNRSGLVALVIGFAVAVGPMALFALQHPDDFNARINQVGIIQSGWLEREAQMLGTSQVAVLAEQFRKVLFAFNHFLDRTDFYRPSTPLLGFPASVLFLPGLVLSFARVVDRRAEREAGAASDAGKRPAWRYGVFLAWFFVVIITGGVLTDNAPSSQRIVSSSVPAMFFVAVALVEFVRAFGALTGFQRTGRTVLAFAVAAVLVFSSVRYYFGPYQQSWVYGSFNGEVSTAIGHFMQRLGPEWKQYFFGAPRMWADFGSATFISKNPYLDVVEPLTAPPGFVDPNYNAAFILLPDRMVDLLWIQQAYPEGQLEEIHRDGKPDEPLLFTAYTVRTKSTG